MARRATSAAPSSAGTTCQRTLSVGCDGGSVPDRSAPPISGLATSAPLTTGFASRKSTTLPRDCGPCAYEHTCLSGFAGEHEEATRWPSVFVSHCRPHRETCGLGDRKPRDQQCQHARWSNRGEHVQSAGRGAVFSVLTLHLRGRNRLPPRLQTVWPLIRSLRPPLREFRGTVERRSSTAGLLLQPPPLPTGAALATTRTTHE